MPTKIQWVRNPDGTQGETWNPTSGCTQIAAGCVNCYAKRDYHRFHATPFEKVLLHPERLDKPLHWKKPRMIFVNSMSDLFHKDVPDWFIFNVFLKIASCKRHVFVILTKRPNRMMELCKKNIVSEVLPNLWLGVSVSNQDDADKFIPILLQTPAAKHIISVEPMLGEVKPILMIKWQCSKCHNFFDGKYLEICPICGKKNHWTGSHIYNPPHGQRGRAIDLVICGGESGPKARPCHPDWVRSLRDQCVDANVPFFFKQWGEWAPIHELRCNEKGIVNKDWFNFDPDTSVCRVGKHAAGNILDGQVWEQLPERWL